MNQFIRGLDEPAYAALPATRRSTLVDVEVSLAKAKYRSDTPETSDDLDLGLMFHTLVLEPQLFDERFRITDVERRGTKAWDAELGQLGPGQSLVKRVDVDKIAAMAGAVRPVLERDAPMLLEGEAEVTLLWQGEHGPLKTRLDWLSKDTCLDLKSAVSIDPWKFAMHCYEYGYDMQAAMGRDGFKALTGEDLQFLFLAVEKHPPHEAVLFEPDPVFINTGRKRYLRAHAKWVEAERTGIYPPRFQGLQSLSLRPGHEEF